MFPTASSLFVGSRSLFIRQVFIGQNGLRCGWRFIIFLLVFVTSLAGSIRLLVRFVPQIHAWAASQSAGTIQPGFALFDRSWFLIFLLLAAFVMTKIEKRSFADYGLPWRKALGRRFWLGAAFGLCGASVLMLLIAAFGGYSIVSLELGLTDALKYAMIWAIVLLVAGGLLEEFLFRGYAQTTLAQGIGFWPAAIVLSALFAALHLGNPGETWPGLLMIFCFGMFAALTLRVTGDLWFVIGLHTAWDWAHLYLFSVPIAGIMGPGRSLRASIHGPKWLTGGTAGPDGSVFAFVVIAAMAALVRHLHMTSNSQSTSV